ncbi:hypothetical protein SteCoe_25002 [Stentor coeruleus]|uniref:Uncharacterized protein n=1 Tax=Stentor coeruleus TaxID=5963 RepID=A0A1R2BG63_9CILI|nr:hypothetical protein SteCoe_25002 [Stentor coeruleus]
MKAFLLLSILLLSQSRMLYHSGTKNLYSTQGMSPSQMAVSGFVAGAALDSTSEDLMPCFFDLEKLLLDFKVIVTHINSFNAFSIIKALRSIKDVLKVVPKAIVDCSASHTNDYIRINHALKALEYPTTAEMVDRDTFALNGVDITVELKALAASYTLSRWFDLGFSLGALLAKVSGTGIIISA